MKHSGAFGRENVKERGVWLRKTLQRDSERILKNVPKQNKKYVKKQLELLDINFLDYVCYYNEKYYRNGFVDGIQLIIGCLSN